MNKELFHSNMDKTKNALPETEGHLKKTNPNLY